jgi:amidohydrolase
LIQTLDRAREIQADLVALRRDLHRHPELAFRETRTSDAIAAALAPLPLAVTRGVARTGIVAELRLGPGPVVALRADMDALPIQQESDQDYRSTVPGVMHACGHDAHAAMLVGACRLLCQAAERRELAGGTIRFLFQPAEEASDEDNRSGAAHMVEAGAMHDVQAVFGLHVGAHLPAGRIFLRDGPIMAGSDTFRAAIAGVGSHAARPEEGVDAVVLAAHAILACQHAVARRISPFDNGVLTIGRISGGVAENVIADHVSLEGTIRYFTDPVRTRLRDALRRGLAVAETMGGRVELELRDGYPPVVNHAAMTSLAAEAVTDVLGAGAVHDAQPTMGAEDFAILLGQAPGAFLWLGAALRPPREHHHPRFDIDESVLPHGAAVLAACAARALDRLRR